MFSGELHLSDILGHKRNNQQVILVYHKISNIKRTKSENLSDCCLVLQLPLANPLKPDVKLRMKV